MRGMTMSENPTMKSAIEVGESLGTPGLPWLVGVGRSDGVVLSSVMEMPGGSDHKPRNSIFSVWNRPLFGLGVRSYSANVPAHVGLNLMIFKGSWRDEDIIEVDHYEDVVMSLKM